MFGHTFSSTLLNPSDSACEVNFAVKKTRFKLVRAMHKLQCTMTMCFGHKQLPKPLIRTIFTTNRWEQADRKGRNKGSFPSPILEGDMQETRIPTGKIMPGIDDAKSIVKIVRGDFNFLNKNNDKPVLPVPREIDICVVGGGIAGLSVAYWLKQRNPEGFTCMVIEKDPTVIIIIIVYTFVSVIFFCHWHWFGQLI